MYHDRRATEKGHVDAADALRIARKTLIRRDHLDHGNQRADDNSDRKAEHRDNGGVFHSLQKEGVPPVGNKIFVENAPLLAEVELSGNRHTQKNDQCQHAAERQHIDPVSFEKFFHVRSLSVKFKATGRKAVFPALRVFFASAVSPRH